MTEKNPITTHMRDILKSEDLDILTLSNRLFDGTTWLRLTFL